MPPHYPLRHLILAVLHLPLSTPLILSTPPSFEIRSPTLPEPTLPPSQLLASNPSCALLSQALSICAVLTPGFVTLLPPQQAHCLCYSSTVWVPNVLEDVVKTCADFASTAVPGAFPPLMNLEGFCLSVGDVDKDAPASVTATSTGRRPGAGMGGGTHGNPNEVTPPGSNYIPPGPTYEAGNGGGTNGGGTNGGGTNGGQSSSGDGSNISNGESGNGSGNSSGSSSGTRSGGPGGRVPASSPSTPTSTVSSGSIGRGTLTPTTGFPTFPGRTITVVGGGAGATKTGDGPRRNRGEVTETEVVLVSLAIAALILFL